MLDCCRKDDLVMIANHFQIVVARQSLKMEIKSMINDQLVESNVLVVPDEGDIAEGGVDVETPRRGNEIGEEFLPVAEAEVRAGLPQFEPFSPVSLNSKGETKLKVCLARLQLEAQEKAQNHQGELDLRLQIRKLEIEAEKCESWSSRQCKLWKDLLRNGIHLEITFFLPILHR